MLNGLVLLLIVHIPNVLLETASITIIKPVNAAIDIAIDIDV